MKANIIMFFPLFTLISISNAYPSTNQKQPLKKTQPIPNIALATDTVYFSGKQKKDRQKTAEGKKQINALIAYPPKTSNSHSTSAASSVHHQQQPIHAAGVSLTQLSVAFNPKYSSNPELFLRQQVNPTGNTLITALIPYSKAQNTQQEEKKKLFDLLNQLCPVSPNWNKTLMQRAQASASTLKLTLYYLSERSSDLCLDSNPDLDKKKKLIAMLILASKYLQDKTFDNKNWAKLTDLHVREVNSIERETLQNMDHRLFVNLDEFNAWNRKQGLNDIPSGSTEN